jgi:hypothetical protein
MFLDQKKLGHAHSLIDSAWINFTIEIRYIYDLHRYSWSPTYKYNEFSGIYLNIDVYGFNG